VLPMSLEDCVTYVLVRSMTRPSHPTPRTRSSTVRYRVLAALCAGAAVAYFSRNILGVGEQPIRHDLALTREQLGFVMGAFFYSYSIMQVPGGWLGERWGRDAYSRRWLIAWAVGTALLGASTGFWSLLAAYLLVGLAQGGLFPCSVLTFSRWIPVSQRSLAGGTLTAFMSSRMVLFPIPRPATRSPSSRQRSQRRRRTRSPWSAAPEPMETIPNAGAWLAILTAPQMWFVCGQQFFRAGGYIFFPTWFPRYLKEVRGAQRQSHLPTADN
jgi:hypothetical protein